MFSTIYYNKAINHSQELGGEALSDVLIIPSVALVVFTVFFISYAHSVFIKRRKKEIGLFMMLGMTDKDINKLLLIENGAIALLSLVVGLISGSVSSRLFFLILMNLLDLTDVAFELNWMMLVATVGIFLLVFSGAVGKSLVTTRYHQIVETLKGDRISEQNNIRSPLLGIVGLLLVIGSIAFQYVLFSEVDYNINDGAILLVGTIGLLIGLYISLSQLGSVLLQLTKRKESYYYKHILFLANVNYKFKQLKGIFMLIITMAMVTIFYTSMLLYFYSSAEQLADERFIYDVSFPETATKNTVTDEELKRLFTIEEHYTLEIIDLFELDPLWDDYLRYSFLSVEQFNQIYSEQLHVEKGNVIFFENMDPQFKDDRALSESEFTFSQDDEELTLTLRGELVDDVFDHSPLYYGQFMIVHQDDFEAMKEFDVYRSYFHFLNLSNWKESKEGYDQLKKRFLTQNENGINDPLLSYLHYVSEDQLLEPNAKIEEFHLNRTAGGLLFFISSFLGALFFVATFMLLYLNVFANIEQERMTFRKLYKIGITKKEVRKVISKELRVLFFLAPVSGLLIAYSYIIIFAKDAGGIFENPLITTNYAIVAAFYLLLQTSYYLLARQKLMKEVMYES
ncbi:ABC transporter permease [Bacillus sp. JCM 19034]|uniref:ABC transporter permease n=1 Tax=Bacillus sp. JCM 19034 TaxID=1481928 RepID=UPI0007821F52|nr:ABC transporter permease [Bacillus sp. JCM 19034]